MVWVSDVCLVDGGLNGGCEGGRGWQQNNVELVKLVVNCMVCVSKKIHRDLSADEGG